MTKTNKIFLIVALVFVLAVPMIAGCDLNSLFGGAKSILAIDVEGQIKTDYVVGENFDANDAKVKIFYSDNTSIEVSLDKSMTNFNSQTVGQKELTVTYQGKIKKLEYRVDAFKFGSYRQTEEYLNNSNIPVESIGFDQTKMVWSFNKDGSGSLICGTEGQAGYQRIDYTWEYKSNSIIKVNLNDTLNQSTELTIKTNRKLERITNLPNPATATNGQQYTKIKYILDFYE